MAYSIEQLKNKQWFEDKLKNENAVIKFSIEADNVKSFFAFARFDSNRPIEQTTYTIIGDDIRIHGATSEYTEESGPYYCFKTYKTLTRSCKKMIVNENENHIIIDFSEPVKDFKEYLKWNNISLGDCDYSKMHYAIKITQEGEKIPVFFNTLENTVKDLELENITINSFEDLIKNKFFRDDEFEYKEVSEEEYYKFFDITK